MSKLINLNLTPPVKYKQNSTSTELPHAIQVETINKMFVGEESDYTKQFWREIQKKLSSYKNQDILKKKYNENLFIKKTDVIEKLVSCKLKCFYCSNPVYIIYDKVRQNDQWTLERLNNNIGHHCENVEIACLQCNLKRRNSNYNNFKFTKQLKISKIKA